MTKSLFLLIVLIAFAFPWATRVLVLISYNQRKTGFSGT